MLPRERGTAYASKVKCTPQKILLYCFCDRWNAELRAVPEKAQGQRCRLRHSAHKTCLIRPLSVHLFHDNARPTKNRGLIDRTPVAIIFLGLPLVPVSKGFLGQEKFYRVRRVKSGCRRLFRLPLSAFLGRGDH